MNLKGVLQIIMDFQSLVDSYECMACVMSVETYPDGRYGNIRVVAGNHGHAERIQNVRGHGFQKDVPYEECFQKNLIFEDDCYRSAVLHEQRHSYVDLAELGFWLEVYMLPLSSDQENVGYCVYSYNLRPKTSATTRTDVAPEVASAVLDACIKLHGTKDFEQCISEVITDIRLICGARRCCILLVDEDAGTCTVLGDSVREGYVATRTRESMNTEFYHVVSTWKDTLGSDSCLIIKNEQDRQMLKKRNPDWYQSLQRVAVETLVLFPLKYNEKLQGYIWASNFDVKNVLKIKGVLELTTFFIASEIENYQLVKRLETLSTIDLLTGSKNRNAMNNRVAEFENPDFVKPKSMGVIFADLNGLKVINDHEGHASGDRLLKKASAILRMVFPKDEIYRAGGDEFMILCLNDTLEKLMARIARLQEICEQDGEVSFSVGYSFDNGQIDVLKDMSLADKRMYEDKDRYYQKYPEKKYR